MFWTFNTSRFQATRPTMNDQRQPPLATTSPNVDSTRTIDDLNMMVDDMAMPTFDNANTSDDDDSIYGWPRWIPGRGQISDTYHVPTEALLIAYPAPPPSQISQSFINRFTDCDIMALPYHFPTILLQFERQRFFNHSPSEALSCEIFNFHESVYQHLLLLSPLQLKDLMQFRTLLSIWIPRYPYQLNTIATAFLPHCHLIGERGTMEVTQSAQIIASASMIQGDTPEDRLMQAKGIEIKPL